MNKEVVGIIAVVLMVMVVYSVQTNADLFAKYTKSQTTTQASNCGNSELHDASTLSGRRGSDGSTSCQNINSNVQGDHNSVSLAEVHYVP